MSRYMDALSATSRERVDLVEKGSETETRAIEQFRALFSHFEAERLQNGVPALYSDDAYFRDTFTELQSAREIEDYFVRSAKAVDECRFDIQDVTESNGNYYFRWAMTLRLDRYKDEPPDVSVGMTHVRFNQDGRIIFQQDYWDAANVYEKIPVMGDMLRFTKKREHSD